MMKTARALAVLVALAAIAVPPAAAQGKKLEGRWVISVTIPVSPQGENRTFTINLDASPRGDSLHGRVTITEGDQTVGGVYRQSGKKVSVTYELPCVEGQPNPCATLILSGKVKNGTKFKGSIVVLWDTENGQNPALFHTSNGKFSGDRIE